MNVLIIGDFSSLAINLKNGLNSLGHHVVNIRTTEGFKNFKAENDDIIFITNRRLKLFGKPLPKTHLLTAIVDNYRLNKKIVGCRRDFDVIIVVNEVFVSDSVFYAGVSLNYIRKQILNGAKMVLLSCGGDTAYKMYGGLLKYDRYAFPTGRELPNHRAIKKFNKLVQCSSYISVISYSYYATIKQYCKEYGFDKPISCIPVPIVIENYVFNSCVGRKIVIFHGKSRPDKGSLYIEEACRRILNDFGELAEVKLATPMAYNQYIKMFDNIDILIDQTNGYGIGMNAAIGLMKGLVVLGGNEPEDLECMGHKSPVINIIPDSNQIYNVLKNLILDSRQIDSVKKESRKFAEEYLSATIVANKMLDTLKKV